MARYGWDEDTLEGNGDVTFDVPNRGGIGSEFHKGQTACRLW